MLLEPHFNRAGRAFGRACLRLREAAAATKPKDNVLASVKTHETLLLAGETGCLGPGLMRGRNLFRPRGGQEVWRQPRQRA